MLHDEARVTVEAGRGGDGCVAFRREKYVPRGGPSGGDGGKGGDIVIIAVDDVHGFYDLRGRRVLKAKNGQPGGGNNRHGANGAELRVKVPVGTEIRDAETGVLLKDLVEPGDSVRIVRGGRGGRGNTHFARADLQAPRIAEEGEAGGRRKLALTLKMIADAGLVGLPNAGKSTLLAALSRSRTKVGGYHFTTLDPHLGVVDLSRALRVTFADLPGLIEGAHAGKGLGDRFLRHIERTRLIVHVVAHDPLDGAPTVEKAYRTVRAELERYSPELATKPEIVALSKCDLSGWEEALNSLRHEADQEVIPFSAVTGEGLDVLLARVARALDPEAPPTD